MRSTVSGLLSESLDPVPRRAMVAPALAKAFPAALLLLTAIDEAHVPMLLERGIVTRDVARPLAGAVLALERQGPARRALDPAREETSFNDEARLIEPVGAESGGRAHGARSRNDLSATMDRARDALERDHRRFAECWPRLDRSPLGAGARDETRRDAVAAAGTRLDEAVRTLAA